MWQKCKIIWGHRLCFRVKAYGKLPWFEKLAHIIQHGLQISKLSQLRQMILVIFCRNGSVIVHTDKNGFGFDPIKTREFQILKHMPIKVWNTQAPDRRLANMKQHGVDKKYWNKLNSLIYKMLFIQHLKHDKKYWNKLNSLIYKMLFIQHLKPLLNVQ